MPNQKRLTYSDLGFKKMKKIGFALMVLGMPANVAARTSKHFECEIKNELNALILKSSVGSPYLDISVQLEVKGKVTDENGVPVSGATILEKGTSNGVAANFDGEFTIYVSSQSAALVISAIGFKTQEVSVDGKSDISIQMNSDISALDEVVVVGYGTQKKSDLTGAVSQISSEEINAIPTSNFTQAMQGKVSGVQVNQNNGNLEGGISVSIRGIGSTGNTSPLYVIDGVPLFRTSLETINQNDIESIDILKDASATAIYGARASNGVVIVTTKSGNKSQKTEVTLSVETTMEKPRDYLELASPEQSIKVVEAAFQNAGLDVPDELYTDPLKTNNEWPDLITRAGYWQNYNLSVSGGDKKTNFLISGIHTNREGVLINTGLKRTSLRLNLDHQINEKFKIGARLSGSIQNSQGTTTDNFYEAPYRNALVMRTYVPNKDENGNYLQLPPRTGIYTNFMYNPVAKIETDRILRETDRYLGNFYLNYKITENLDFNSSFGFDYVSRQNDRYFPILEIGGLYNRSTGRTEVDRFKDWTSVTDQLLTYNKEIGKHDFKILAGFSLQKFNVNNVSIRAEGTLNNALNRLSNQPNLISADDTISENGLVSYFSRLNYNFDDRYLFTATIRRDGSSKFGSDNKYGWFPSASVGWVLSNEQFLKDSKTINNLKLRVSYGGTGNQSIGDLVGVGTVSSGLYAWGNQLATTLIPNDFDNDQLKWETTYQFDTGVDLSLFNGRIQSTIDYYHKKSSDFLVNVPVAAANGISNSQTLNLGEVLNEGLEFAISSVNIENDRFKWTSNFNISTNKNEVLDIGNDVTGSNRVIFGNQISAPVNRSVNITTAGKPIGSLIGYDFEGIWQLDEAQEAAAYGLEPGDTKYRDVNNDGIINNDDTIDLGQAQPKVYGGFTNTFEYNNFSFSFFFNWQTGHKLLNTLLILQEAGHHDLRVTAEYGENFWTLERPSNEFSRPHRLTRAFENVAPSSKFMEDASFLKLQQLSLSYRLPKEFLDNSSLSNVSLSLIGSNNLWILTKYKGLDPEVSSSGNTISAGLDLTPYPIPTTYSLRLNINF